MCVAHFYNGDIPSSIKTGGVDWDVGHCIHVDIYCCVFLSSAVNSFAPRVLTLSVRCAAPEWDSLSGVRERPRIAHVGVAFSGLETSTAAAFRASMRIVSLSMQYRRGSCHPMHLGVWHLKRSATLQSGHAIATGRSVTPASQPRAGAYLSGRALLRMRNIWDVLSPSGFVVFPSILKIVIPLLERRVRKP